MSAAPGPDQERFAIPADRADSIYKWVLNDTTTIDLCETIGHTGGASGRWRLQSEYDRGADLTDANVTIHVTGDHWRVMPAGTLSTNRTITLGTTGAVRGSELTITRQDSSSNDLIIVNGGLAGGTLTTLPATFVSYAKFKFDGTNWVMREFAPVITADAPDDPTILVPHGSSRGAAINAAIVTANAGYLSSGLQQTVRLLPGTYVLEVPLTLLSGVRVEGSGMRQTRLTTTMAPNVSQADVATNAMILAQGAINTVKADTTLTSAASGVGYYPAGSRAFSVASVGTLVGGDYVVINGHENYLDALVAGGISQGDNITSTEVVQIDTISSLTLRLKHPTMQHTTLTNGGLGTPKTVRGVTPIVSVAIADLTIAAPGGTMAVGALFDYAQDVTLERVGVEGFSRAGINFRLGTRNVDARDCYSHGEVNCAVLIDSSHSVRVSGLRTNSRGLRYHANGTIRALVFATQRSIDAVVEDFEIVHGVRGVKYIGGCGAIRNGTIRDMLVTDTTGGRWPASDGYSSTAKNGIGIDLGTAVVEDNENGRGLLIGNVTVAECRQGAHEALCSVYLHDYQHVIVDGLYLHNNPGASPHIVIDGESYRMHGISTQDCGGTFNDIQIRGCEYAFRHWSSQDVVVTGLDMQPQSGSGTVSQVGLWFDDVIPARVKLKGVVSSAQILFGPSFGPDWTIELEDVVLNEWAFSGPAFVAQNTTGSSLTAGNVVAFDPAAAAGTRKLVTPSAASKRCGVVVWVQGYSVLNNAYCFVAPLPTARGMISVGTGAVQMGDLLEAAGGGFNAAVNNSAAAGTILGRALQDKAAGSAGTVAVGPAA